LTLDPTPALRFFFERPAAALASARTLHRSGSRRDVTTCACLGAVARESQGPAWTGRGRRPAVERFAEDSCACRGPRTCRRTAVASGTPQIGLQIGRPPLSRFFASRRNTLDLQSNLQSALWCGNFSTESDFLRLIDRTAGDSEKSSGSRSRATVGGVSRYGDRRPGRALRFSYNRLLSCRLNPFLAPFPRPGSSRRAPAVVERLTAPTRYGFVGGAVVSLPPHFPDMLAAPANVNWNRCLQCANQCCSY